MPAPTLAATAAAVTVAAVAVSTLALSRHRKSIPAATAPRPAKTPHDTSLQSSYKITSADCEDGRMYGGALLKLLDVAAGTVAAKHSCSPCLTVSADRVIFLLEIRAGDVVHLAAAVNRAWGSSMEIGVRAVLEKSTKGERSYCCHAYFTFVCRPPVVAPLSFLARLFALPFPTPPKPRAQVPAVTPTTTLEQKRFLLAGRRRERRLAAKGENDVLLEQFGEQILAIEHEREEAERGASSMDREALFASIQKELLVEAYLRTDPKDDIQIVDGLIVAHIEGEMISAPVEEIERLSKKKGHGGWRTLLVKKSEGGEMDRKHGRHASEGQILSAPEERICDLTELSAPLTMADSLVLSIYIVRPIHCNSKGILFGGELMRWVEATCAVSALRVSSPCLWSSAATDSLSFKTTVFPGEVVYLRSVVLRVYDSSIECFCHVLAEDRNSAAPKLRLVSQSFFTLVAIDQPSGRPLKGRLRQVELPEGPARAMGAGSDVRRADRLADKGMLQRVYA